MTFRSSAEAGILSPLAFFRSVGVRTTFFAALSDLITKDAGSNSPFAATKPRTPDLTPSVGSVVGRRFTLLMAGTTEYSMFCAAAGPASRAVSAAMHNIFRFMCLCSFRLLDLQNVKNAINLITPVQGRILQ